MVYGIRKVSENDQEISQSHTADTPMIPRGRHMEHLQPHDIKQTYEVKQSALSSTAR